LEGHYNFEIFCCYKTLLRLEIEQVLLEEEHFHKNKNACHCFVISKPMASTFIRICRFSIPHSVLTFCGNWSFIKTFLKCFMLRFANSFFTNKITRWVVYQRLWRVDGQSPWAQNLKKVVAWGAVGPKIKKWAKASHGKIKKVRHFGFRARVAQ